MSSWISASLYTRWSSGDAAFLAKISGGARAENAELFVVELDLETVSTVEGAMETWPVYEFVSRRINVAKCL